MSVCKVKTQITLGIHPVRSESSLYAQFGNYFRVSPPLFMARVYVRSITHMVKQKKKKKKKKNGKKSLW